MSTGAIIVIVVYSLMIIGLIFSKIDKWNKAKNKSKNNSLRIL